MFQGSQAVEESSEKRFLGNSTTCAPMNELSPATSTCLKVPLKKLSDEHINFLMAKEAGKALTLHNPSTFTIGGLVLFYLA